MKPIITSLLDTDLYKFTMQQVVLNHFPTATVEYAFKCRNDGVNLAKHLDRINREVDSLCEITFNEDELNYLGSLRFIKPTYVSFLQGFRLNRKHINITATEGDELAIKISGPWFHTILFEVPVLSIINQVYFEQLDTPTIQATGMQKLLEKVSTLRNYSPSTPFRFSDFGTRRRFSKEWQREVVQTLARQLPYKFTGTSNVLLAKDLGLTPIGTMAHEYLQAFQALDGSLANFQKTAFDTWAREYRGDLGIALTDVVGVDAFLRDFDLYFCKLFDGVRHDSGDPFQWADKILNHYMKNKIDPKTKSLVFSDGLNVPKSIELHKKLGTLTNPVFGIGTNLTNDLGLKALNIVIKMTSCNNKPVAKISDSPGKTMCTDHWHLKNLHQIFLIPESGVESSSTPRKPIK